MFIDIQLFAHKKGGGSTKNGRDSNAQRLGVKRSEIGRASCRERVSHQV